MSGAALALPSPESWTCLGGRLALADSATGLERFDVLACGTAAADRALRLALERSADVHAIVVAAAEPPADGAFAERLAALKVPVLALFGTRDSAVPPAIGRRWRAILPGCHLIMVYDAGSDIAADRPEAVAGIVLEFLADPGAFLVNRRSGVLHP